MKLLNSKKLKLRNKAFVWTGKVRNVVGLNVLSVGCQDLKNNGGAIGTVGKSQKPFEADEKMKVATQDTTKTSLLTLSGSKISIVSDSHDKPKYVFKAIETELFCISIYWLITCHWKSNVTYHLMYRKDSIKKTTKKYEIITWTTKIQYSIFWQVNYQFQCPFIIGPIVSIYELKYRMWCSGTPYHIISYKERTLHEITKVKNVETA